MAEWVIEGTDERMPYDEFKALNLRRNQAYKDQRIFFVDNDGEVHEDINAPIDMPAAIKGKPKARMGQTDVEMEVGEKGETFFPVRCWLPSTAFTLFNYAKKAGASKHADLVSFLWDYAQWGFMQFHKLTLSLTPTTGDHVDRRLELLEEALKDVGGLPGLVARLNAVETVVQRQPESPPEEA